MKHEACSLEELALRDCNPKHWKLMSNISVDKTQRLQRQGHYKAKRKHFQSLT